MSNKALDTLVSVAIKEHYWTLGGRVVLPLQALVELGLVDTTILDQLRAKMDEWLAKEWINPHTYPSAYADE